MGMIGLWGGPWGVLFPDEEDEEDEDGGLRNGLVANDLGPSLTGALFLKSVVSGVFWRGLEK